MPLGELNEAAEPVPSGSPASTDTVPLSERVFPCFAPPIRLAGMVFVLVLLLQLTRTMMEKRNSTRRSTNCCELLPFIEYTSLKVCFLPAQMHLLMFLCCLG